jgi:RNA polymerase sigma-70 factor (ECF subfamily)
MTQDVKPHVVSDLDVCRVFREHSGLVERVLRRHGVAERDLPDAQQEVFLVVHRKLPEFEQRSLLSTWLYRITVNVASEFRRKACNRHEQLALDASTPRSHVNGLDALERRDQLAAVLRALDKLDADKREVLVLYDLLELPMHEVASRLGCPLKTAFSRLYAGRRQILAELRERSPLLGFWFALRPLHRSLAAPPSPATQVVVRSWPLQASIAVLASVCAVAPATPPATLAPLARAQATHALRTTSQIAEQIPSATAATRATKLAGSAAAPLRAKPTRKASQLAAATKSGIQPAHAAPTATEPATSPQPQRATEPDDFTIVHAGAVDVLPQVQSPLGLTLVPAERRAARIRLDGPREPADAIEAALRGENASAR